MGGVVLRVGCGAGTRGCEVVEGSGVREGGWGGEVEGGVLGRVGVGVGWKRPV